MRRFRAPVLAVFVILAAGGPMRAQRSTPVPAPARLQLTVDSIMRGPDLVGAPPSNLRWSVDSQQLYLRRGGSPARKRTALYVVGREAGNPDNGSPTRTRRPHRRPTGDGITARRRLLGAQGGDIFIHDPAAPAASVAVTRTSAPESNPRWARNGTHVTYVRDGNLFIVPVQAAAGGARHAAHRRRAEEDRATPHRQPEVPARRRREADRLHPRAAEGQKQKADEKDKADKLPAFELQDRQTAADLMLSPDDTHVFILVAERPAGAKSTIVPNYVTESGYTEDIPARTNVGDTQDRRLLAVLNLKTGKTRVGRRQLRAAGRRTGEAGSAGAGRRRRDPRPGRRADREIRWSMPVVSRPTAARWSRPRDPRTTRIAGSSRSIRRPGRRASSTRCRTRRGCARRVPESDVTLEFLPDNRRIWFLSERDGWMHLYTLDVAAEGAKAKQLTERQVGSERRGSVARRHAVLHHHERGPSRASGTSTPSRSTAARGRRSRDGRLERGRGSHPTNRRSALVYSYSNKPPEVFVMANRRAPRRGRSPRRRPRSGARSTGSIRR